ncbi:MAG: YdcH family protein [Burkholderiaceae bacterium]
MSESVDNHPLGRDFPESRDAIHKLKTGNAHFANLMHKYEEIDRAIVRAEQGVEHVSAEQLEPMKVQRVRLKDQLYQMIVEASA